MLSLNHFAQGSDSSFASLPSLRIVEVELYRWSSFCGWFWTEMLLKHSSLLTLHSLSASWCCCATATTTTTATTAAAAAFTVSTVPPSPRCRCHHLNHKSTPPPSKASFHPGKKVFILMNAIHHLVEREIWSNQKTFLWCSSCAGAHWESTNPFCQKCARQCHQLWLSGDKILCQKDNHQKHLVQQVDKTIEQICNSSTRRGSHSIDKTDGLLSSSYYWTWSESICDWGGDGPQLLENGTAATIPLSGATNGGRRRHWSKICMNLNHSSLTVSSLTLITLIN